MKAGLACPYSLDGPGGVQEHIRDLAEALMGLVHGVSVISPAGDDELLPGHVVPAGRAVPSPATAQGAHLEVARPVWVLGGAR
jgi:phosphatidylinositol alpha-mannosyltransferase